MKAVVALVMLVALMVPAAEAAEFGKCETCVFVIERIKKGTNMLLPSICAEIYEKYPTGNAYSYVRIISLSLFMLFERFFLFTVSEAALCC